MEWKPIETAPRDGTIFHAVTKGGYALRVKREAGFATDNENRGGCWVAADEGDHPDCWTDGVCWGSNENYLPSDPLVSWSVTPPNKEGG